MRIKSRLHRNTMTLSFPRGTIKLHSQRPIALHAHPQCLRVCECRVCVRVNDVHYFRSYNLCTLSFLHSDTLLDSISYWNSNDRRTNPLFQNAQKYYTFLCVRLLRPNRSELGIHHCDRVKETAKTKIECVEKWSKDRRQPSKVPLNRYAQLKRNENSFGRRKRK